MLCKYGCGREAVYKNRCDKSANRCPTLRKKNSDGLKLVHKKNCNHWRGKQGWRKGLTKETDERIKKISERNITPLEKVMIENSTYYRGHLKRRLLENRTLKNKCDICGLENIWNNKKIIMVLDHKNGIRNDHRLENLRMLCPNCNSQTDTFCGKNMNNYQLV